jgi:hypothetical protein
MPAQEKFGVLRVLLKTIGLSQDAVDDILDRINDFLSGGNAERPESLTYPYHLRDDFLSVAEHSFFMVLRSMLGESALVHTKVNLGDLFYVKSSDPSEYRIYTNKIDRKHVDFLVCDPRTVRPIVGIELDDKSHRRQDRQERDELVENVFRAANLPLVRVPAKNSYSVQELAGLLKPYLAKGAVAASIPAAAEDISLECPKCGARMVLRTARNGANEGQKFWGCTNYPRCRGIVSYSEATAH